MSKDTNQDPENELHEQPPTRINSVRKVKGLTLKELAELVGTTPQTIQRLETGNMTVSMLWMARIAKALGVDVVELLREPDAPPPPQSEPFAEALKVVMRQHRRFRFERLDGVPIYMSEDITTACNLLYNGRTIMTAQLGQCIEHMEAMKLANGLRAFVKAAPTDGMYQAAENAFDLVDLDSVWDIVQDGVLAGLPITKK